MHRPVSGLEILVAALQAGALPFAQSRQILEEIKTQSPSQPTCADPILEWLKPLFDLLAAEAPQLYPDRDSKLAALERWAAWIESPFDLLGFVNFARSLQLAEPQDRARAAGLISGILARAARPTLWDVVSAHARQPARRGFAVHRDLRAGPMILTAYRQFVTRALSAPVCRSTPEEAALRRELASDLNRKLERWPIEGVAPLSDLDIARLQGGSTQLDGAPPAFDEPASCAKARLALLAKPSDESWAAFVAAWNDWTPEQLGGDLRYEDSKLSTLLLLDLPDAFQSRLAAKTLEALSSSRLKAEEPGLWTALALDWFTAHKHRASLSSPPADPALSLLWALVHGRL